MPVNALIRCYTKYIENITFDFMIKEIKLESKITEVVCKIKINYVYIEYFNLCKGDYYR